MARLFQFSIRSLLVAVTILALGIAALLSASAWWEAFTWGAALFILSCAVLLVVYRGGEQRAFWLGFAVFGGMYLALLLYSFTADWKNNALSNNPLHYNSLATTKLMALVYESALPASRRQEYIPAPVQAGVSGGQPTSMTALGLDGLVVESIEASAEGVTAGPGERTAYGGSSSSATSAGGTGPLAVSYRVIGSIPGVPLTVANPNYIPPANFISIGQALWLLLIAAIGGKVCQLIYRTRPPESRS